MEQSQIDRLMIVVVQVQDVEGVFDVLCDSGIACTHLSSSGGFLQGRNVTLLIGLAHDKYRHAKITEEQYAQEWKDSSEWGWEQGERKRQQGGSQQAHN